MTLKWNDVDTLELNGVGDECLEVCPCMSVPAKISFVAACHDDAMQQLYARKGIFDLILMSLLVIYRNKLTYGFKFKSSAPITPKLSE